MSIRRRWVLQGEWSGYYHYQRKVVHRVATMTPWQYAHLTSIGFTDGTLLRLSLRPCKPREVVKPIKSYGQLIEEAAALGKAHVEVRELA